MAMVIIADPHDAPPDDVFACRYVKVVNGVLEKSEAFTLGARKMSHVFDFAHGDVEIWRVEKGTETVGMLMNTGIRNLSFEYSVPPRGGRGAVGALVGPSTRTLLMGQFEEIGCGPGVTWRVTTFRGRAEAEHQAMREA